jgi:hypothetical protein
MRKYVKKKYVTERDELVEVSCDLCGLIATDSDWDSSTYAVKETEVEVRIRQKDGKSYPDGGWGTEYTADICPDCFKNKLIPWLESQGCKAERKEWEY